MVGSRVTIPRLFRSIKIDVETACASCPANNPPRSVAIDRNPDSLEFGI